MDSEEISSKSGFTETFSRLLDEFTDKEPYSKKLLRDEMEKALKPQSKKGKFEVQSGSNLRFKEIHKRIRELRLARPALPLTLKKASVSRIPILSRYKFIKRNERRPKSYDVRSFGEEYEESFDELYSFFKSGERKVSRPEVEGTRSPKNISEKPSVKIAHLQRKVKPKVISNKQVEDISETNKILDRIREQKERDFETDLNKFSKTSAFEINNNENISKPRETSYSKLNSTNSVSEKSFTDEFTILGTETSLKAHQFRVLKNSTLILSSEIDRSVVENMNLETDESNASRISSENTQKENESVDNISFVTLRKKCRTLKYSSPFSSKEDEGIEINNSEQDSILKETSYSNLKIDDSNASRILSEETKIQVVKSSSRTEFFESGFEKTQEGSESEKFSPILSRGKIKISSKKRKRSLEEKAPLSEVEITDSEKTTEELDIWNLKQQYGKAYTVNIGKKAKRNPGEPVSDSEKTTELLEVYLRQFRPLKNSTLILSSEVDRSVVENMNLESNASRISSENTQKENESVDNISFVTLRKKCRPLKYSSPFSSKEDEGIEINNSEQDSKPNGTSYV